MRSILFVCMGNICRSPTAEAVVRGKARAAGFAPDALFLDSCGTGGWHAGSPPDGRAVSAAARRGFDMSGLQARRIEAADFQRFDLILAMDRRNLRALERMAPAGSRARLQLFLDGAPGVTTREVPDPYYGGTDGFDAVLDLIEAGADHLVAAIDLRHYASS